VLGSTVSDSEQAILVEAAPLIQERITVLSEAPDMLGFLFVTADKIEIMDDARAGLPENAAEIATAAAEKLAEVSDVDFKTEHIQELLNALLIEQMQLKPRVAFGPLRTAISGRRISPPLFESMQILGKAETIARLKAFASAA
jgi:glutamyl-tRNA synthetase